MLLLLGLAVCDGPQLSLDLDADACVAITLETVDAALLPGWEIAAMVAEQVEGTGAWILGTDPKGRTMLQPWPAGVGLDLSGLGDAEDLDLQPGRIEGESWLVIDRPWGVRVWRLGDAARGELQEVPGLADFPGPGDWTRRLLFVGDTPHLLAAPAESVEMVPRFQVAAIDRQTLTLGPMWPIDYLPDCVGEHADDDSCISPPYPGDLLKMLAVTPAGSMRGGAVLLAVASPNTDLATGHDAFLAVLTLYADGPGGAPVALRKDGWYLPGTGSNPGHLQGQLATDARSLFSLTRGASAKPLESFLVGILDLDAAYGSRTPKELTEMTWSGPLLQLGAREVIGNFAEGRWSLSPFKGRKVDTLITGSIELDPDTQVTSTGREQLLLRPPGGPARRVRARCVPAR